MRRLLGSLILLTVLGLAAIWVRANPALSNLFGRDMRCVFQRPYFALRFGFCSGSLAGGQIISAYTRLAAGCARNASANAKKRSLRLLHQA